MRKPAFCIHVCEKNKGAAELHVNRRADQRLFFRYTDSVIPVIPNSGISSLFCGCTAWFVSDWVKKPKDRFSYDAAHIKRFLLL